METRRRSKQGKIDHSESRDEYHALISVWVVRMLLGSAAAFKGFFEKKRGFMDDDLREFLGFSDENEQKLKVSAVKESLRRRLLKNEKRLKHPPPCLRTSP